MHERNVKAFEVIVAIQRPVRVHQILARARRIEGKLMQRKPRQARFHLREQFTQWMRRIKRGKDEFPPRPERNLRQVISRRWKILCLGKLRHVAEGSIQVKSPAVIAADQALLVSAAVAEDVPAMRAHV